MCQQVSPPCVTEADRYSLEALRHIHQEMDDDQDGGIEVEESVEVNARESWLFWKKSENACQEIDV